jgi:hypothetical protein
MEENKEAIIVIYTHKDINVDINELRKRFNSYKNRIEMLVNTLQQLQKNFLTRYKYPIYILCENYDDEDKKYIVNMFGALQITFEDLHPTVPEYLNEHEIIDNINRKPVAHWRNMGYRHMCKFFAVDIFAHPVISKYKYYMRIDDDSVIDSSIYLDVFKLMNFSNLDYVYRVIQRRDCDVCNEGMNAFFASLGCDFDYNRDMMPFNNFHIMRVDAMKGRDILQNKMIPRYIYNKRWGDAPLHGAYIKMFNLKTMCTEVSPYCSFTYKKWGLEFPKSHYVIF